MHQIAEKLIYKYYETMPEKITALGGGFYGRVFLAEHSKEFGSLVVKIYLYPNLAQKEAQQLKELSFHSIVKMPQVYFVHNPSKNIPKEAIIMEYIPGVNAGDTGPVLTDKNRRHIANSIVDNLISYHQVTNPKGFGEIGSESFDTDWKRHYASIVNSIFYNAERMYAESRIDKETISVVCSAFDAYDKIFYLPIAEASLIHGDYNAWNILLNEELTDVRAVIDPFNCCWADSELDLYQLSNANGKDYGLLDIYASKVSLSENFLLKNCFYELFNEIMHFYDANIDVKYSNIPEEAKKLKQQMKYFGLM